MGRCKDETVTLSDLRSFLKSHLPINISNDVSRNNSIIKLHFTF